MYLSRLDGEHVRARVTARARATPNPRVSLYLSRLDGEHVEPREHDADAHGEQDELVGC